MALAEDASTPSVIQRVADTSGTVSTAFFSPPANSLVVVNVVWMWAPGSSPGTMSCKDSNNTSFGPPQISQGFTVPPARQRPLYVNGTSSAIFANFYASAPGFIAVTVTNTSAALASAYLAVRVVTGAANPQTGLGMGHSATSGDLAVDLYAHGSWAYACGGRPGQGAPVVDANTLAISSWQDTTSNCTAAVARLNGVGGANPQRGIHRVGWIQNVSECSVLEVVPVPPPVPPQTSITPFQTMTADLMNNWLLPRSAYKPADTSRSNTTTQTADPDLSVPVTGNAFYLFRCLLGTFGPSGAGIDSSFGAPAGAIGNFIARNESISNVWGISTWQTSTTITSDTTGGNNPVELDGWLNTVSGGAFTLNWAQHNSNGTACTVKAGSYLTLWRIG